MKRSVWFDNTEIEYEWTVKAVKNLNLRIKRDGRVYASSPHFVSAFEMDRFILQNAPYILSTQQRFFKQCQQPSPNLPADGAERIWILGRQYDLLTVQADRNQITLAPNVLQISMKAPRDDACKQRLLDSFLGKVCKEQTLFFVQKHYVLVQAVCKEFPQLSYRKMKSRWGSCHTQKRKILFNKYLAHVPPACIEYVVCHELMHLIHPNHSPAFHQAMSTYMPDWKSRKKRLAEFEGVLSF